MRKKVALLKNWLNKSPASTIELLVNKYKTEDTVFIIGGGRSLFEYLPSTSVLEDHDIICCNNAYKLFPNAMLLHFADEIWWRWHNKPKHDVVNNFNGIITTAAGTNSNIKRWEQSPAVSTCFTCENKDKKIGINTDKNRVAGNNTGHQAVNIAVHMGYKQIVLLGFDLHMEKQTHWHNDHERSTCVENYKYTMIPGFELISAYENKLGFKVFNLNHKSALRCFSFANLDDFI